MYSEACAVIKPDSIIRAHVKTHLLEFVERHTFMHEGKVCVLDTGYRGRHRFPYRNGVMAVVCSSFIQTQDCCSNPQKLSKRAWRKARDPKPPATFAGFVTASALKQIGGLWFACHFR